MCVHGGKSPMQLQFNIKLCFNHVYALMCESTMLLQTSLLCRPHPVKPLTSSQSEKKEGRSVLEKLKSTIHPGRSAHQVVAEPERSQVLCYKTYCYINDTL